MQRNKIFTHNRKDLEVNLIQRYFDSLTDETPLQVQDYLREQRLVLSILTKKDIEIAPRNASLSQLTINSLTDNDSDFKKLKILGCKGKDYKPSNYLRPRAKKELRNFSLERQRFRSTIHRADCKSLPKKDELNQTLDMQRMVMKSLKRRYDPRAIRKRHSSFSCSKQ